MHKLRETFLLLRAANFTKMSQTVHSAMLVVCPVECVPVAWLSVSISVNIFVHACMPTLRQC